MEGLVGFVPDCALERRQVPARPDGRVAPFQSSIVLVQDYRRAPEAKPETRTSGKQLFRNWTDIAQIAMNGEQDGGSLVELGDCSIHAELVNLAGRVADEPAAVDQLAHDIAARGVERLRRVQHQDPAATDAIERRVTRRSHVVGLLGLDHGDRVGDLAQAGQTLGQERSAVTRDDAGVARAAGR